MSKHACALLLLVSALSCNTLEDKTSQVQMGTFTACPECAEYLHDDGVLLTTSDGVDYWCERGLHSFCIVQINTKSGGVAELVITHAVLVYKEPWGWSDGSKHPAPIWDETN